MGTDETTQAEIFPNLVKISESVESKSYGKIVKRTYRHRWSVKSGKIQGH